MSDLAKLARWEITGWALGLVMAAILAVALHLSPAAGWIVAIFAALCGLVLGGVAAVLSFRASRFARYLECGEIVGSVARFTNPGNGESPGNPGLSVRREGIEPPTR